MPLPAALGRFNRRVTNPILGPAIVWLPGYWIAIHRGRRTGHPYRTPILLFGSGERRTVALTYGPRTEWTRNVLADGGCELERRGRRLRAVEPRLYVDPARRAMPRPVRWVLGLLRSDDFLELRLTDAG